VAVDIKQHSLPASCRHRTFSLSIFSSFSFFLSTMDVISTCCECLGRVKIPLRTLPCLHSACLECLESLVAQKGRTLSSSSSRCNGSASVNPNEIKCEICETGNEEDAVSFCRDCVRYFCAGCQRAQENQERSNS